MISKELLSRVLSDNRKLDSDIILCIDGKSVKYGFLEPDNEISYYNINIYELSHICKLWVVKNSGWTLQSYTNERGVGICRVRVGDGQEINKLIGTSEVESVFKATEWVCAELKNKGKLK